MPKDLDLYTVNPTDSIREAMQKITANKHRVVVVMDGIHVAGTVSDGDIRRAFLRDVLPMSPVEKIMNINCVTTTESDPQKQMEILRQAKITLLPIVTATNELLDVALAYEP